MMSNFLMRSLGALRPLIITSSLNAPKSPNQCLRLSAAPATFLNRSSFSSSIPHFTTTKAEILPSKQDIDIICQNAVDKINNQISCGADGRLFAVVHLCGKQFKITPEDIIILEGYWPPVPGDKIKLEKVLLVGGVDFTLIGRPVLPQGLVHITATVIEKDLSHTKPVFFKRRRKQYMRLNFHRSLFTMLRINEISVSPQVNSPMDVEQYSRTTTE